LTHLSITPASELFVATIQLISMSFFLKYVIRFSALDPLPEAKIKILTFLSELMFTIFF